MNEELINATSNNIPDLNESKQFRDKLAKTLKETRSNRPTSSGGRIEARGRRDFERENNREYASAKNEHRKDVQKKSEEFLEKAAIVKDVMATMQTSKYDMSHDAVLSKVPTISQKEVEEALLALETAIDEGITVFAWQEELNELDRSEYDVTSLVRYIRGICNKVNLLSEYYIIKKDTDPKGDKTKFDRYYTHGIYSDYEIKNGISSEERKRKFQELIERFKIKK